MNELIQALAQSLKDFPDVLLNILTALGGAIVSVIVAARISTTPMSTTDILGQFVVCWMTGGILGPSVFTPIIQSIANKLPDYAICFVSSGVGWWFWTIAVPKKQDEFLNKKTEDTPPPTP